MQESNFNVIIDTENYNAVIGESAKIDVGQAISNVQSGKAEIEAAVQDGKAAFNLNATAKTGEFNQNAVDKTGIFDDNTTAKIGDFNTNAIDKTGAFDNNYTAKLGAFNENAAAKQAEVDASAALAKQYAIGEPVEPAEGSAKYWAGQVGGLISRVDTIEGKIPSAASSSNQLADKDWVESQEYITEITSSDVTTALGYTPYNSSNPSGYQTASDVQTAIAGKQDTLVSGTNIKTINNNSILGSGNVDIDALPSQTGHSGEFLTTDGTDASWGSPDLSGKANIDLSNCTKPYVVETYVNGTEWYRVYSDGWVEQGGRFSSADKANTTVTFLRPFANTDYTPIVGQQFGVNGQTQYRTFNISTISSDSMVVHNATNGTNTCIWMACGYVANN